MNFGQLIRKSTFVFLSLCGLCEPCLSLLRELRSFFSFLPSSDALFESSTTDPFFSSFLGSSTFTSGFLISFGGVVTVLGLSTGGL